MLFSLVLHCCHHQNVASPRQDVRVGRLEQVGAWARRQRTPCLLVFEGIWDDRHASNRPLLWFPWNGAGCGKALVSPNIRWMIQIPRLFSLSPACKCAKPPQAVRAGDRCAKLRYKATGQLDNFGQMFRACSRDKLCKVGFESVPARFTEL